MAQTHAMKAMKSLVHVSASFKTGPELSLIIYSLMLIDYFLTAKFFYS